MEDSTRGKSGASRERSLRRLVWRALCAAVCLSAGTAAAQTDIQWVQIPGGTFVMGAKDLEGAAPRHRVNVKPFFMAKTLVTFKQYGACVMAGACTPAHVSDGACRVFGPEGPGPGILPRAFQGDDQPVVCVDWNQAKAFAAWAGGRLPTEAEWEYAARGAGKDRHFPWGDADATCAMAVTAGCSDNSTAPVCSKPRGNSEQGLCDMTGNAWEWVEDSYHPSYVGAPSDGSAWLEGGHDRVFRGGSFHREAAVARAEFRSAGDPNSIVANIGLRLAQ